MAKLLFIQDYQYEYLGPIYISAMLKKEGHDCKIVIGRNLMDFDSVIQNYNPNIVGFSIMSGSAMWANEISKQIKKRYGLLTIFGGVHATFYPEYIKNDGVDMLVRGEGEEAMLEVMNHIDDKKCFDNIKNIVYKKEDIIVENEIRELSSDLDIYPFPDRRLYEDELMRHGMDIRIRNVIISRGCPLSCTFCQEVTMREIYKGKGKYVRLRKIDKVLEELELLKNTTNTQLLYFVDDFFGLDYKWMKELLPLYKKNIGLEFSCLVRADFINRHRDYPRLLRDAGCRMVAFGIESGSERVRNELLNKKLKRDDILFAASLLHDAGIKFRAFNMLGLPGETLSEAYETVQLNIDIKTDYPWCAVYLPIKGTKLADYAIDIKVLPQNYFDHINKMNIVQERAFFCKSSPLQMKDMKKIINLQRFFQIAVMWPWTFPFIKILIKIPPNFIFDRLFDIGFYIVYTKSEGRNWWKTFLFAVKSYFLMIKK